MDQRNPNNRPSPRRSRGAIAFVLPYLVLIALVVLVITALNPTTKTEEVQWSPNPTTIAENLDAIGLDEMQQIQITEKERVLIIQGQYKRGDTTYIFYAQTASTVEADIATIYEAAYRFENKLCYFNSTNIINDWFRCICFI